MPSKMMSEKKELLINTIIIFLGNFTTSIVSLILLPFYTNILSPSDMGIIDLIVTYVSFLAPLFSLQLEQALFFYLVDSADDRNRKNELFSTALVANLIQCFVLVTGILILDHFYSLMYKEVILTNTILNIFVNLLFQFVRGVNRNGVYATGGFILAISGTIADIICILILDMGLHGKFVSLILSRIITIIYIIVRIRIWEYIRPMAVKVSTLKEMFRFSLPMIPNQLSWWIFSVSDRTVIAYSLGTVSNGIYSISNKFSGVYVRVYNVFDLSWTHSAAAHIKDKRSNDFFFDMLNKMFCCFACLNCLIIAGMPIVFPLFVPNQGYAEAYLYIPILMIAGFLQAVAGLYSSLVVSLKETKVLAQSSALAAVLNLGINVLLIKKIGLYAAVLSTFVSFFVLSIIRYYVAQKRVSFEIKIERALIIKTIVLFGMVTVFYYLNEPIVSILIFCIVVIYSFFSNREIIFSLMKFIKIRIGDFKTQIIFGGKSGG